MRRVSEAVYLNEQITHGSVNWVTSLVTAKGSLTWKTTQIRVYNGKLKILTRRRRKMICMTLSEARILAMNVGETAREIQNSVLTRSRGSLLAADSIHARWTE